jgi:hypothetical protein
MLYHSGIQDSSSQKDCYEHAFHGGSLKRARPSHWTGFYALSSASILVDGLTKKKSEDDGAYDWYAAAAFIMEITLANLYRGLKAYLSSYQLAKRESNGEGQTSDNRGWPATQA